MCAYTVFDRATDENNYSLSSSTLAVLESKLLLQTNGGTEATELAVLIRQSRLVAVSVTFAT